MPCICGHQRKNHAGATRKDGDVGGCLACSCAQFIELVPYKSQLTEYKERVKFAVTKATCDLKSEEEMKQYAPTLNRLQLLDLVYVLNGELQQLKQAVLEVK